MSKKYLRVRVASPKKATTCRTQALGKAGTTKRIACKGKDGKWYTQSFLFPKTNYKAVDGTIEGKTLKHQKMIEHIKWVYGRISQKGEDYKAGKIR